MILSVRAESIILSAPPAESMILSAPPERRWKTPAVQWAAGRKAIALGDGTAVAQSPPPGAHLGIFWREKTSSTRKTLTRHSAGKMYQRSPSELTAINHLALFSHRAMRRWEYSHNARSCQYFADQNLLGPPNTLTKWCSILVCKSL